MSDRRLILVGMLGVARRDAALLWSYRLRVVSQTLSVFFTLSLFYYISRLVSVRAFATPDAYFAFVAVGIVVLHVLTSSVAAVPLAVRQELVAGTFERFAVSPLGATAGITGMILFPMASALVLGVAQLALATVVFGLDIELDTALLAIPVAALGAVSFTPFALLIASAVVLVKQIGGGVTFLTAGMAFVGGFFFPVALLPDWMEWMSYAQPFTPALELLRHLLVGTPMLHSAGENLVRLVAFAVVLFPMALATLERAIALSTRRGTLIEY